VAPFVNLKYKFSTMRFIPTKVHGLLDYVVGIALITAPWTFNFNDAAVTGGSAKNLIPIILGAAAFLYSLFTDYEWGASRKIAMPVHLVFDFLSGAFLAASPWIFGFADEVYLPHLVIGIFEMVAALTTSTHPGYRSQEADRKDGKVVTAM
jgi:hypothetical protein